MYKEFVDSGPEAGVGGDLGPDPNPYLYPDPNPYLYPDPNPYADPYPDPDPDPYPDPAGSAAGAVGDTPFKCTQCLQAFKWHGLLRRHMLRSHKVDRVLGCPLCTDVFTVAADLHDHMQLAHPRTPSAHPHPRPPRPPPAKTIQCPLCPRLFSSSTNLSRHARVHSGERPYGCVLCPKTFNRVDAWNKHMRRHADDKPFGCGKCRAAFVSPSDLRLHLKRVHTRPVECAQCGKRFGQPYSLRRHLLTHSADAGFDCAVCGRRMRTMESYTKHYGRVHGIWEPFDCTRCDLAFPTGAALRRHYDSHLYADRLALDADDKTDGTRFAADRLALVADDKTDGTGFAAAGDLGRVEKKKKKKKKSCERAFRSLLERSFLLQRSGVPEAGRLPKPLRLAAAAGGARRHECKVCRRSFSKASFLRVHSKTHAADDERERERESADSIELDRYASQPFGCRLCGQRFRFRLYVEAHLAGHVASAPVKSFRCTSCQKRFRLHSQLLRHLMRHLKR